ncbi:MAG: MFS transporter [Actinomycetota bacterium]|nr:MFS transporter [Actinomycetota bacterium]
MSAGSILRDRAVVALLVAEVVSTSGMQMTWLALPWFVLLATGSATRMTLVLAAELIGLAAFGLPAGKALGRLGARRTMVLCDGLRGPLMLVIPILHWTSGTSFPVLLAVAFALGALGAPYFAAQKVIVPELLGEDERRVTRANAFFQGATRATLLLGPVIGGALIGVIGAPSVLVVDAATYVVAVVLVAGFVPARPRLPTAEATRVQDGLRFLSRERLLRVWWPTFALGDAAWTAFFASIPVIVVTRFGEDPAIAGWLIASFGIGAVIGNLASYRVIVPRFDGYAIIAACVMGQALPLWLLSFDLPPAGLSAAIVASGIANGIVNPSLHSIMTLRIPAALRPTAMTAAMTGWALVNPLGVFAAGPVLDAAGPEPVLVAFAAVQTVTMAVVALTAARERSRPVPAPLARAAGG